MRLLHRIQSGLRGTIRDAIPPSALIHWVVLRNWIGGEPELRLLSRLCDPRRVSIDVGASLGAYAYLMRRDSREVVLLEPRPAAASWLTRAFGRTSLVFQIAASDEVGTVVLRIPRDPKWQGMATVESANRLNGIEVDLVEVPARRLDDLPLGPVGLVKIDVEGHESAVLRGAMRMIAGDHPAFIIEAEERHRSGAVRDVERLLAPQGYDGWFFRGGRLHPISDFDVARDQPSDGVAGGEKVRGERYINNFIFLHRDDDRRRRLFWPNT